MVQKWAIGAMINVSGSIAINLGTNLMKLSHKMEKGETQQEPDKNNSGFRSAAQKPSAVMSSDDLEAAEAMISRPEQQHQQQHHHHHQYFPSSSKGKNRTHGVEMTAYSAVAVAEEPEPRGLRAGSGKDPAKRGGGTRAAAAGAPAAAPAPPAAAAAAAAREGKHPERWRRASTSSKGLGGADEEAGGGVGRSGYEEEETTGLTEESLTDSPTSSAAGVRRRSLSSPRPGMLANGAFGSGGGAGVGSSGGGDHFEWKTKVVWYLGAVVLVAGSLVNFASFGFAPQSLLASLGSVQFISNVVFGKVILREIVTRRIVIGTATIILGNTLTLCFSPHQDDNFSTHQLKAFYDLEYNTLLLLELLFALAMHAAYKSFKRSKEQGKPRRYSDLAMPLAYAMCSAIVGTQSVVNAKCLSELLTLTFQGQNQMGSPFTYLVIAIWFSTTVFWLVRMNRALAMFHGLFIIPALQVFWTFFSVIGGGFYFEEFHTLHVLGGLGFAVGVLVVFCGVYLLAPRTQTDHGRRSGAGGGDDEGVVSDGEESDLTRMLRLDDESPATSPRLPGGGLSPRDGMEAGDEEIDWDHTRMLSLGFFPSISTDQDVAKMGMGKLANNLEGIDGEGGHGDSQGQAGAGTSSARVEDASSAVRRSNMLTLSPPWSKPKDTPPRTNSPSGTGGGALSPFGQGGGGGGADGVAEGGETERRRRRTISGGGGGGVGETAAFEPISMDGGAVTHSRGSGGGDPAVAVLFNED